MKEETAEKVLHKWLRKHAKKRQVVRIHSSEKIFVLSLTKMTKKDLLTNS